MADCFSLRDGHEAVKDAKEVQLMVINGLAHPDSQGGSSSRNWPGFVGLWSLIQER